MADKGILDAVYRYFRKDDDEAEAENVKVTSVTVSSEKPKRRRSDAPPMSYERRLASYGLRDPNTGAIRGTQSGPQRQRIRHKIGHQNARRQG